jgi:hypothetical protein
MRAGFALSGAIGAGKSTTTRDIISYYSERGLTCEVVGFAGPLKVLAVKLLGRPINKATDRAFLQRLGMGFRSSILSDMGKESLFEYLVSGHPDWDSDGGGKNYDVGKRFNEHMSDFIHQRKWGYMNHWIDLFDENLNSLQSDILLVEDMRFVNEYEYLCGKLGFKSIRVECDQQIREERITVRDGVFSLDSESDASEREWKYIPHDVILRTDDRHGYKEDLDRFLNQVPV